MGNLNCKVTSFFEVDFLIPQNFYLDFKCKTYQNNYTSIFSKVKRSAEKKPDFAIIFIHFFFLEEMDDDVEIIKMYLKSVSALKLLTINREMKEIPHKISLHH